MGDDTFGFEVVPTEAVGWEFILKVDNSVAGLPWDGPCYNRQACRGVGDEGDFVGAGIDEFSDGGACFF